METLDRKSDKAPSEPTLGFGYEYLKVYIDTVGVRVAQVSKDFLEH